MLLTYCQWARLRALLVSFLKALSAFQSLALLERLDLLKGVVFCDTYSGCFVIHGKLYLGDLMALVGTYLLMLPLMNFLNLTELVFTESFLIFSKNLSRKAEASSLNLLPIGLRPQMYTLGGLFVNV